MEPMIVTARPEIVVRVRRPPACDPPYDDERHPDSWLALPQPQLDLASLMAQASDQRGEDDDGQPAAPGATGSATTTAGEPATAPASRPSPAQAAVAQFLRSWLEILNGYRPVGHVRALTSPLDAASVIATTTDALRRFSKLRPPAGTPAQPVDPVRLRIRRVRLCQPRPDIAEVAAVIVGHGRAWAVAVRLEHRQDRWLCANTNVLWSNHAPGRRPR